MRSNSLTRVSEFRLKLYPNNFDIVQKFYQTTLAFPVVKSWNRGKGDQGVMFDTGSAIIELLSFEDKYKPIVGCNVSLEVRDVWTLWKKLKNNAGILFSLRDNSWGDSSFCIADPEGFQIIFFTKTQKNKPL